MRVLRPEGRGEVHVLERSEEGPERLERGLRSERGLRVRSQGPSRLGSGMERSKEVGEGGGPSVVG